MTTLLDECVCGSCRDCRRAMRAESRIAAPAAPAVLSEAARRILAEGAYTAPVRGEASEPESAVKPKPKPKPKKPVRRPAPAVVNRKRGHVCHCGTTTDHGSGVCARHRRTGRSPHKVDRGIVTPRACVSCGDPRVVIQLGAGPALAGADDKCELCRAWERGAEVVDNYKRGKVTNASIMRTATRATSLVRGANGRPFAPGARSHGYSTYGNWGCRCDACVAGKKRRNSKDKASHCEPATESVNCVQCGHPRPVIAMGTGTTVSGRNGYCELCLATKAVRHGEAADRFHYRMRLLERGPNGRPFAGAAPHHGDSTIYDNWGCRCDRCVAAKSDKAKLRVRPETVTTAPTERTSA